MALEKYDRDKNKAAFDEWALAKARTVGFEFTPYEIGGEDEDSEENMNYGQEASMPMTTILPQDDEPCGDNAESSVDGEMHTAVVEDEGEPCSRVSAHPLAHEVAEICRNRFHTRPCFDREIGRRDLHVRLDAAVRVVRERGGQNLRRRPGEARVGGFERTAAS